MPIPRPPRGLVLALTLPMLAAAAPAPEVRFADVTAAVGLTFTHANSATSNKYLIETMGGGVALLDYDRDGRLDVFFVNGARLEDPMPAGKMPDKRDPAYWNRLYRQRPDGTFTDVTESAGLTGRDQTSYGMGVAAADYDNDGALDLFVTRYVEWTFATNGRCGEQKPGYRAYCHPDNYQGVANLLFHNNGDGTFTDVSQKMGVADANGKGLGVAFADYDDDGFTDVYVANDSVQSFLYHNLQGRGFEEVGLLAGVGFTDDGKTFAGMGVDFADYDNDGRPDLIVTDLSNERYRLYRQNEDHSFRDATHVSGVGGVTLPYSGWGTRFVDYDNDGWKDLFVAQGHVMDTIEKTSPNLTYQQPPLLLRNESGRFSRVEPGDAFTETWAGRGAAFGDLDNDGDVDVVLSNVGQKAVVLRNDGGNRNNWLAIQTVGTTSNRDGIGCLVKVVSASGLSQSFTVNTAVGYLSASDKRLLVGLGSDATAKLVEIRWPSGIVQRFENVAARQTLTAKEPAR